MKNSLIALMLPLVLSLNACALKECPTSVTVNTRAAEKTQYIDIQVPFEPKRVVASDFIAVDTLKSWGMADRIVGMAKGSNVPGIEDVEANTNIANLGGLKALDLEQVKSLNPDIIFVSGRGAGKFDELSKIAPTIVHHVDYMPSAYSDVKEINERMSKIFGTEKKFKKQFADFDKRVAELNAKSEGKTAFIINIVNNRVLPMGDHGRVSMIINSFGFDNPASALKVRPKGNEAALKFMADANPDYIFVLSKDLAVGTEGAVDPKTLIEVKELAKTKAYKNKNIIYLTHPIWYLAEGGVNATDIMISDVEKAFE